MSGDRLSAATQALLKTARSDGPGAAARAKVWSGVSAAVGGAGAAAAGVGGVGASGVAGAGAGMSAAKMLAAGTLLGGAVTVGLAAMLLHFGPLRPSPGRTPPTGTPSVAVAGAHDPSSASAPALPPVDDSFAGASAGANLSWVPGSPLDAPAGGVRAARVPAAGHSSSKPAHGGVTASARAASPQQAAGDDPLTQEASLVAGARSALASGNAQEALRLVRVARSMPTPQLVPEELTVEAQALRALGKADDARGVDATLHSQYPDSALAR